MKSEYLSEGWANKILEEQLSLLKEGKLYPAGVSPELSISAQIELLTSIPLAIMELKKSIDEVRKSIDDLQDEISDAIVTNRH